MYKSLLSVGFALLFSVNALCAGDFYSFDSFSDPHVFQSQVTCVHSAESGFCWVGMKEGLARFNNGQWALYTAGNYNLPSSEIRSIGSDSAGNNWIATSAGLVKYVPERDDFESAGIRVSSVLSAGDRCYFGSVDTLYSYDVAASAFSVAAIADVHSGITSMSMLQDDRVLLFFANGTPQIYDPSVSRILPLPVDMSGSTVVWADSRGRIWRSVSGSGVQCYSSSFNFLYSFDTANSALSSSTVLCFCERDGKIWMGTDGGGISIFDPDIREFQILKHSIADRESLPSRTITSMCLVKGSNDILAGRLKGGAIAVRRSQLICYDIASPGPTFLAPEGILCLYQGDNSDVVWIGADGTGLFQYNLLIRKFIYYSKGKLVASVKSMAALDSDRILLFCGQRGFLTFNIRQENFTPFTFGDPMLDSASPSADYVLTDSPDGSILITSADNMLKYDPASHSLIKVSLPPEIVGNGTIRAVAGPSSGKYFYNGRYLLNYDAVSMSLRMLMDAGSSSSITSVALDQNDRLWLSTDKGLGCFNVWSGSYECQENEFCRGAKTILCDVMGRVWIGGRFGLNVYNSANGTFYVLDEADGMTALDLESNPRLLSRSGDLFFGGTRSFLRIDRDFSLRSGSEPFIGLNSISVDGKKIDPSKNIRLDSSSSAVSLKAYVTDDYCLRHKHFKFMVEGPSNSKEEFGSETGELTYLIHDSGSYRILASCSTRNAGWTEWKEIVSFRVKPDAFGSVWELASILLLLAAALFFYLSYKREKKNIPIQQTKVESSVPESVTTRLDYLERAASELVIPSVLVIDPLEKAISTLTPGDPNYSRLKGVQKQALKIKSVLNSVVTVSSVSPVESVGSLLNDRIKAVAESFHDEASSRGITLRSDFDSHVGYADFDATSLKAILATLLMNALRNSPDNSGIIVETKYQSINGTARITVTDNGIGIKEACVDDVFKTNYVSTGEQQSTFIGLPYIQSLAIANGTTLVARNSLNGGSYFYFDIPVSYAETVSNPNPVRIENFTEDTHSDVNTQFVAPPTVLDPAEMIGGSSQPDVMPVTELACASLLLVEDDPDLQDYLKSEFEDSVKTLYQAYNGVEALEILNNHDVDIIVSDVMMPEMDGFELCRHVKTTVSISHIPIILLTARSDENSRINGYKNGADDYITKPFDMNVLVDSINKLFMSRQQVRSMFNQSESMPEAEAVTFSSADEQFLQRFNEYITDNIENPDLDVAFIVDIMGVSRTVLYNKIKMLTGMNIQNYINKMRMEHVIHLLKTTDLAFGEIAERSGFSSPRYFSTSFKNYTGKTPSQYRKDMNSKDI